MSEIKYISLFSGIEAASVAWEPLGWKPVAFSEIEPFPCSVLAKRFPEVPNLGDITKIDWKKELEALGEEKIDVVIGGSPCQSFSVAGNREGLQGESRLMFEYIRAIQEIRPETLLWENVPGALSSDDGKAFQQLLQSLDELGYGLAWRVLDAQFYGVAQRRRRVFLVGCLGDPGRAAEVLFDSDSLRWDHPSSREKRKELAGAAEIGAGGRDGVEPGEGNGSNCLTPWDVQSTRVYRDDDASWTLQCNEGPSGLNRQSVLTQNPTYAIQGNMVGRSDSNGPQGSGVSEDVSYTLNTIDQHCVAFSAGNSAKAGSIGAQENVSPTLQSGASGTNMTPTVCYAPEQGDSGSENGASESDDCLTPWDVQSRRIYGDASVSPPLQSGGMGGQNKCPVVFQPIGFSYKNSSTAGGLSEAEGTCPTLNVTRNDAACCYKVGPDDVLPFNQGQISCKDNRSKPQFGDPCHTISAQDSQAPTIICRTSAQANAETDEDCCGTLARRGYKDPPIVAFQQNQRDEIRFMNDDGDVAGSIVASSGSHNTNYVCYEDSDSEKLRCEGPAMSQYGEVAGTLTARGDSSPCADRGYNMIACKQNANEEVRAVEGTGDVAGALVSQSRTRQTIVAIEDKEADDGRS